MADYYHLTPVRNVRSILKHGLQSRPGSGLTSPIEDNIDGVFLGRDVDECLEQFNISDESPAIKTTRTFVTLHVRLPDDWILKQDKWGYVYSPKNIPPSMIRGLAHDDYLENVMMDRGLSSVAHKDLITELVSKREKSLGFKKRLPENE